MIHDGLYPRAPEQDGFDVFDHPPEQSPVIRIGTGAGYYRDITGKDLLDPAKAVAAVDPDDTVCLDDAGSGSLWARFSAGVRRDVSPFTFSVFMAGVATGFLLMAVYLTVRGAP